jgi:H+/Cl- antiporter ClcA
MPDVISWAHLRTLALAAALGPVVAIAVVLFESAVHGLTRAVWEDLPDAFGWSAPQAWYVVLVPGVAGLLVVLALMLPGHGGHGPLDPLGADPFPPLELLSVLLAGLATLGLGLVLGPEAPPGQGSPAEIVGESSASVLALLVLAKGVAYTLSLGAGFRGGPVFPALTLGLAAGTLAAILFPGLELTPAVVAE